MEKKKETGPHFFGGLANPISSSWFVEIKKTHGAASSAIFRGWENGEPCIR